MVTNLTDLTGRAVVIAGGCGAIGRVAARALADQVAAVLVNDVLDDDEAQALLHDAGLGPEKSWYVRSDAAVETAPRR